MVWGWHSLADRVSSALALGLSARAPSLWAAANCRLDGRRSPAWVGVSDLPSLGGHVTSWRRTAPQRRTRRVSLFCVDGCRRDCKRLARRAVAVRQDFRAAAHCNRDPAPLFFCVSDCLNVRKRGAVRRIRDFLLQLRADEHVGRVVRGAVARPVLRERLPVEEVGRHLPRAPVVGVTIPRSKFGMSALQRVKPPETVHSCTVLRSHVSVH